MVKLCVSSCPATSCCWFILSLNLPCWLLTNFLNNSLLLTGHWIIRHHKILLFDCLHCHLQNSTFQKPVSKTPDTAPLVELHICGSICWLVCVKSANMIRHIKCKVIYKDDITNGLREQHCLPNKTSNKRKLLRTHHRSWFLLPKQEAVEQDK